MLLKYKIESAYVLRGGYNCGTIIIKYLRSFLCIEKDAKINKKIMNNQDINIAYKNKNL